MPDSRNARIVGGNAKGAPWLRRPAGEKPLTREERLERLKAIYQGKPIPAPRPGPGGVMDTTNHCPICEQRERDTMTACTVLADIREALGVGHKPMLEELPEIVRRQQEVCMAIEKQVNGKNSIAVKMAMKRWREALKILQGYSSPNRNSRFEVLKRQGMKLLGVQDGR